MAEIIGTTLVQGVYVCTQRGDFPSKEIVGSIEVGPFGFPGDYHTGSTRAAGIREKGVHERGEIIKNLRQISAVFEDDLAATAIEYARLAGLKRSPRLSAAAYKANLLLANVDGIDLDSPTKLPKDLQFRFENGARCCVLVNQGENDPCTGPGKLIAQDNAPGLIVPPGLFPKAAVGRRGLLLTVVEVGPIFRGQRITILQP